MSVRLKNIKMYDRDKVPDHILAEVDELVSLMITEFSEMTKDTHSNIVMAAINTFHAICLMEMLTERSVHEGAKTDAIVLVKNVEFLMSRKNIPFEPTFPTHS